jgi:hypothetical protein
MTVPDQVAVTGVFDTAGHIVVTGARGHLQLTGLTIHSARGREPALTPLQVKAGALTISAEPIRTARRLTVSVRRCRSTT